MNPQNSLSVKFLLRRSWEIYKTRFAVLFGILSAPLVVMVLSYLLSEFLPPLSFVLLILAGLLGWASQLAMIYALKTPGVGVLEAYRLGVSKLLSVIWIGILIVGNLASAVALPLVLAFVALSIKEAGMLESSKTLFYTVSGAGVLLAVLGVIFAIYLSILFQFSTYSLIIDDHKGVNALSASTSLVKGRWFMVFVRILAMVVIFTIPVAILDMFMQDQQGLFNLIQSAFGYIIAPFIVAYIYSLFVGMKEERMVSAEEDVNQRDWVVGRAAFGFATILALLLFLIVVQKTTYFPGLKEKLGVMKAQSSLYTK
ncbi:MAG: hypothetical protein AAB948_00765 [Patescibacteria group bacterium]